MTRRLALAAFLVAASAQAAVPVPRGHAVLPGLQAAAPVKALAMRAVLRPSVAGTYRADFTLTLMNSSSEAATFEIACPVAPDRMDSLQVALGGDPLRVTPSEGVAVANARLEAGEVAVLQVAVDVEPERLAGLAPQDAGWIGLSRGALLQPLQRLTVSRLAGNDFGAAPLEVELALGERLLASAVLVSPGGSLADGVTSWSLAASEVAAAPSVTWAVAMNETLMPQDAAEAEALREYWSTSRRLSTGDLTRLRGVLDGSARSLEAWWPDADAVEPTPDLLAAAAVLATWLTKLPADAEAARDRAPARVASRPAAPPTASTPPPAHAPGSAAEPVRSAPPAPRAAAPVARSSFHPEGDAAELVTVPPDPSWREEHLLRSPASVPRTAKAATRWAARALREGHGTSRAVLARESIPALHGKTWAPGYVADFFGRQAWYRPDPEFSQDALTSEERVAWGLLDDLISALAPLSEPATEVVAAVETTGRSAAAPPATAPVEPPAAALRTEVEPAEEAVPTRSTEFVAGGSPAAAPASEPAAEPSKPTSTSPRAPAPRPAPTLAPAERAVVPPGAERPLPTRPAPVQAAAAAASGRQPVPWLRSAPEARIFLANERSRGPLERARIELAAALIEARHGRPFEGQPAWRARFEAESWYEPRSDYGARLLGQGALEALTLLRGSLGEAAGAAFDQPAPRTAEGEGARASRTRDGALQDAAGQPPAGGGPGGPEAAAPTATDAAPAHPADVVPGPEVPWLRGAMQARLFLADEDARGLDFRRLEAAIAVIEARHGCPFAGRPGVRARFVGQPWYEPLADWTPAQLSEAAREAITILRRRLPQ